MIEQPKNFHIEDLTDSPTPFIVKTLPLHPKRPSPYTPPHPHPEHSLSTFLPPPPPKQCRICLQNQTVGHILSPCKCLGSVQHTHRACLAEWIRRKLEAENDGSKIKCEFCHETYNYEIAMSRHFDCAQLSRNFRRQKCAISTCGTLYILFLVGVVAFILVLGAAQNGNLQDIRSSLIPSSTVMLVYITMIILILIVLAIVAVLFLTEYVIRKEMAVQVYNPERKVTNYKIGFTRNNP